MPRDISISMTADEFIKIYKDKNWTMFTMADRWNCTDRYIRKLKGDPNRARPYWKDALIGLPDYITEAERNAHEGSTMDRSDFFSLLEAKGWTDELILERWDYGSKRALNKAVAGGVPSQFVDAVKGLPDISNSEGN